MGRLNLLMYSSSRPNVTKASAAIEPDSTEMSSTFLHVCPGVCIARTHYDGNKSQCNH